MHSSLLISSLDAQLLFALQQQHSLQQKIGDLCKFCIYILTFVCLSICCYSAHFAQCKPLLLPLPTTTKARQGKARILCSDSL
jgi:hypothetical protein